MPEIAEVARTVHFIRKNLVGKTLAKVTAQEDANVFGKVGTSAAAFEKAMTGKTVVGAGQQGKYFWMLMSSPPHPVMHFGMSGWLKYKNEHTYYYQPKSGEEKEAWPPKYWKFILETAGEGEEKIEAAFVDLRRFGRVRLVDCKGSDIRTVTPLVENGPDPVIDAEIVTEQWLTQKCRTKKVPIKAMLLDQANISGIGNWVGDEIMYHAKMHPEQYANTLSDAEIKRLHHSIHFICKTSVDLLGDSDKFPKDWLFKHRWGKGKKDAPKKMPSGEKIEFLTVGGRTSAVVPSVQKKTGGVAKEMGEVEDAAVVSKPKPAKKGKSAAKEMEADESIVEELKPKPAKKKKSASVKETDEAEVDEPIIDAPNPKPTTRKNRNSTSTNKNIVPTSAPTTTTTTTIPILKHEPLPERTLPTITKPAAAARKSKFTEDLPSEPRSKKRKSISSSSKVAPEPEPEPELTPDKTKRNKREHAPTQDMVGRRRGSLRIR